MKKLMSLFILLILLPGCGTAKVGTDVGPGNDFSTVMESEVKEGDFIFRLYSEKESYEKFEEISVYAELTYVGNQDNIDISHSASPFYFPFTEVTRNFEVPYAMDQPLITTTLTKNLPLRKKYVFAGGYSDQDSKEFISFISSFMGRKGFPEGNYIIHGSAQFSIEEPPVQDQKSSFQMKTDISFEVK